MLGGPWKARAGPWQGPGRPLKGAWEPLWRQSRFLAFLRFLRLGSGAGSEACPQGSGAHVYVQWRSRQFILGLGLSV